MSNFTVRAQTIILYNKIENYTFEIIATFPRDQRVKKICMIMNL